MFPNENRRLLVIDDNPSIHDEFRKILTPGAQDHPSHAAEAEVLFGGCPRPLSEGAFEVDFALQGDEGLQRITLNRQQNHPYALAFVDSRMPPGINGIETIERAWRIDPEMQFVVCSGQSDHTARDLMARVGVSDRLLLLRKPCDASEILLLATTLCHKWNLAQAVSVG